MFVEKYLQSLNTSDLRDDDQHRQTEALAAAALADLSGGSGAVFGSLLARAKYADGICHKTFEAGNHNLAVLLNAWTKVVAQKGLDRQWLKIKHPWDIHAAHSMYAKIARMSLAHWLEGGCETCNGTKIAHGRACAHCGGTGLEPIQGGAVERQKSADMISELEGLYQSHSARASAKLRQAA
jgi:hypothetical protein